MSMEQIEMDMGLSDVRGSVIVDESFLGKCSIEKRSESLCESTFPANKNLKRQREDDSDCPLVKRPVVVLSRLPDYKISALRPPTPTQFYSEDECQSTSESDTQWEPESDSNDSTLKSEKKHKREKSPKSSPRRTSEQNNFDSVSEAAPIIVSTAFALCPEETRNTRPDLPEQKVAVGMMVLARKKHMMWHRGKIVEILTKENGRIKFKVTFEGKGKSLVSGHHIAFDTTPKLEQLYIGGRVVISSTKKQRTFPDRYFGRAPQQEESLKVPGLY